MSGKRYYAPGTVALVRSAGKDHVAMRDNVGTWASGTTLGRHITDATNVRLLVVIDPEDPEQVARLADAFCTARWSHVPGSEECDPLTRSSMTTALRSLITPPPKPAEPTGLGAVVEAEDGERFVRYRDEGGYRWTSAATGAAAKWDEIAAVKILSGGVR